MRKVESSFAVDDDNRNILLELFNWSWNMPDAQLDPNKGILLCGPIGIGKSTLMRGLQHYQVFINQIMDNRILQDVQCYDRRFAIRSAAEIALYYTDKGQVAFNSIPNDLGLCIDEIGREPLDSKHYGTTINPIQTLLQLRYDRRHQSMTHGTTNLRPNELAHYYGDYIADRCRELFNVIELTGNTRRH